MQSFRNFNLEATQNYFSLLSIPYTTFTFRNLLFRSLYTNTHHHQGRPSDGSLSTSPPDQSTQAKNSTI